MRHNTFSEARWKRAFIPLPLLFLVSISLLIPDASCRNATSSGRKYGQQYIQHDDEDNGDSYETLFKKWPVPTATIDLCPRPFVPGPNTFSLDQYAEYRTKCTASCNDAGYCCTIGNGGCMNVPCTTGCHIAFFSENLEKCKTECKRASSGDTCDYTWNHAQIAQAGFNPSFFVNEGQGVDKCVGPEDCGCTKQTAGEEWGFSNDCGDDACEAGCELAHSKHLDNFFHGEDVEICKTLAQCFDTCEVPWTDNMALEFENNIFKDDGSEFENNIFPEDESGGCAKQRPRFLFAGQSNMEGNPHDAREGMFDRLVDILNEGKNKDKTIKNLIKEIGQAEEATEITSANEARILYEMSLRGLMKEENIRSSMDKVSCSFSNPLLSCEQNLSQSNCGNEFGPELMFGHSFSQMNTIYKDRKFGITKVAVGGTEIENNWMKSNAGEEANYWNNLIEAISAADGTLQAFVWFQGESDSFDEANKESYLENLTQFVADVREEIYTTSRGFKGPEDVPVVIVELGAWIHGIDMAVIEAQRTFAERTPKTALVKTGSSDVESEKMTSYYHFDAASMLIIGDRIATAVASLLDPDDTRSPTEEPVPSSAPLSSEPSAAPTKFTCTGNTVSLDQYKEYRTECTASCNDAGYCCTLGIGGCNNVPCTTGCHIAFFSENLKKCKKECKRASSDDSFCTYTWNHAQIVEAGFNPFFMNDGYGVDKCVGPEDCGCTEQKEGEDWGFSNDCGDDACEAGCELAHSKHFDNFFHGEDVKICTSTTCEDDPDYRFKNNKKKSCKKLTKSKKKRKKFCFKKDNKKNKRPVNYFCPKSCGTCPA